jgi:hypothetical protein
MSDKRDATSPKTLEDSAYVRKEKMSTVLQEVQNDLHGPITRELLGNVTCKLQKLITDDLKLQSVEVGIKVQAYPQRSATRRAGFSVDENYQDECVRFTLDMNAQLHRMYSQTAAALHDAMSQPTLENLQTQEVESKNYFAGEMRAKVRSFGLALRAACAEILPYEPTVPDGLRTTRIGLRGEMGSVHKLLTRLKGV